MLCYPITADGLDTLLVLVDGCTVEAPGTPEVHAYDGATGKLLWKAAVEHNKHPYRSMQTYPLVLPSGRVIAMHQVVYGTNTSLPGGGRARVAPNMNGTEGGIVAGEDGRGRPVLLPVRLGFEHDSDSESGSGSDDTPALGLAKTSTQQH